MMTLTEISKVSGQMVGKTVTSPTEYSTMFNKLGGYYGVCFVRTVKDYYADGEPFHMEYRGPFNTLGMLYVAVFTSINAAGIEQIQSATIDVIGAEDISVSAGEILYKKVFVLRQGESFESSNFIKAFTSESFDKIPKEVFVEMHKHEKIDESHYMRSWIDPKNFVRIFDYGSHSDFFYVYMTDMRYGQ